jgi:hypothetical protein
MSSGFSGKVPDMSGYRVLGQMEMRQKGTVPEMKVLCYDEQGVLKILKLTFI